MAIMIEKVQSVNRDKIYYEKQQLNRTFMDALIPHLRKHHVNVRTLKNFNDDEKAYIIEKMNEQQRAFEVCLHKAM